MGANTYRLMSGFAAGEVPEGQDEFRPEEEASVDALTQASKVVYSSSLQEPLDVGQLHARPPSTPSRRSAP